MAERSWLPAETATREVGHRPWAPEGLPRMRGRPSYVVIEEIIGGSVGLAVCDWPQLDGEGRMVFAEPARLAAVDRSWLEQQLADHREPPGIAERSLRIGDVFAVADVELGDDPAGSELTLTAWAPPIYDLTAAARAAAKMALYGAVAPVLDPGEARDLDELVEDVEG